MNEQDRFKALVLKKRPVGLCQRADFELIDSPLPKLAPGEVLVRLQYISVDPTNRIWMSDQPAYMPPVALGEVMRALALGSVEASEATGFEKGDFVTGLLGWRDKGIFKATDLVKVQVPHGVSPSSLLGPLGMTGLTAYFGMMEIAKPAPGETVVVSAAAGAVGSVAGQIAKACGARVIGIAGSAQKCSWLVEKARFDGAICYRQESVADGLDRLCPNGIDIYFENVGGDILDSVLPRLALNARIPLCGLISQYNAEGEAYGPKHFAQILMKRAFLKGFIISDFAHQFPEGIAYLSSLLKKGQLTYQETVLNGLDSLPDAVNMLFRGENSGKLIVQI